MPGLKDSRKHAHQAVPYHQGNKSGMSAVIRAIHQTLVLDYQVALSTSVSTAMPVPVQDSQHAYQ